jgi:hypothetical protein
VIFFVYLYQGWKYKVDYTRVNEFGQGGDEEETDEKKANKPLTSSPNEDTDKDEGVKVGGEGVKEGEAMASGKVGKKEQRRRK